MYRMNGIVMYGHKCRCTSSPPACCSVLQAIESVVGSAIAAIHFLSTVFGCSLDADLAAQDVFGRSQDRRPVLECGKWHSLALAEGDQVWNSQSYIHV